MTSTSDRARSAILDDRFRTPADGVGAFERRWGNPEAIDDDPVFLLASSWRSGSTLTQRLIVESGDIAMWGEPWDHSEPVRVALEMLTPISDAWPRPYYVDPDRKFSSEEWIANLYPGPHTLVRALRGLFSALFKDPAAAAGYDRWGLKEVRLDGGHATALHFLYPKASLIYLIRNPYDAWESYRGLRDQREHGNWWYHEWPDVPVDTPARFGVVWKRATASFLSTAEMVGAHVIRYEDLAAGIGIDALAAHVGAELSIGALELNVGRTRRDSSRDPLSVREMRELRDAVEPTASALGYTGPSYE